jgi:hypothetical protein
MLLVVLQIGNRKSQILISRQKENAGVVPCSLATLSRGINTGPHMNIFPWFFASQKIRILLFSYVLLRYNRSKSQLCYDRRSVGQSVWVSSTHLRPKTRFLLLSVSCGAPSLTRGRVCRLQLLLALASAFIFGSESRGTRDRIFQSQIRDFTFRRLLRLAGLRWRYSTSTSPPQVKVKTKLCYDRRSVGQFVLE